MGAITPDGQHAVIAGSRVGTGPRLFIIRLLDNAIVNEMPTDGYADVVITPDQQFAYLARTSNFGVIDVLRLSDNTFVAPIIGTGGPISALAISPDGQFLYVSVRNQGKISVIQTSTNTIVENIFTGGSVEDLAVSPDGRFVYVADRTTRVHVIRTSDNTVIETIALPAGNPVSVAFTPDGNFAYVAALARLATIRTSDHSIVEIIDAGLSNNFGKVVVSPNKNQVYVTTNGGVSVFGYQSSPQTPVILVHGWCGSQESFGMMGQFLLEDLNLPKVAHFNYDSASSIPFSDRRNLRELASRLALYTQDQIAELGVEQVDLVAHSMGGLLARAWMAGLTDVPYSNEIRRLVLAGTPNFGVFDSFTTEALILLDGFCEDNFPVRAKQAGQMFYGSNFLKELNEEWDQKVGSSVIPPNILTIVGCTTAASGGNCITDNLVEPGSASLPVEAPDYLVRYVKHHHFSSLVFSSLVDIDSRDHETYQLVKSFLQTGTADTFYEAPLAEGLIVVPLIRDPITQKPLTQRRHIQFVGESSTFGPRLPHCDDILRSTPFIANKPSGNTGLWTLSDVLGGCWVVQVDSRKYISTELLVDVTVGRPMITMPLVVSK